MTKPTDGAMLPCPFCGEDAKSIAIRGGRQVFCTGCHAKGPPAYHGPANIPPTQKRAIDGWNYREAVAPAVREMNIALKKAHEAIEALIRAEQNPQNDRIAFKASDAVTYARRMKKATSAKYRHLIEESGDEPE